MATDIDDAIDGELVAYDEQEAMALVSVSKAEIDGQIATAKRYPRSLKMFVREATEMVQMTEEIAAECMYALKRGGKTIEGPSARFAEIIASAWGNCRAGARVIGNDGRFVTSQGVFMDLQRNMAITYETQRRITDKTGKTFVDDMIGVTANAACSIALRNAVLKGIPKAFWKPVYDTARRTAVGDASTLVDRRTQMLGYFAKLGVAESQVFELLEIQGVEDINLDHLALLKGIATSIKDGEQQVDDVFGNTKPAVGSKAKKSNLTEQNRKTAEPATDTTASVSELLQAFGKALERCLTESECDTLLAERQPMLTVDDYNTAADWTYLAKERLGKSKK